jgi:hypothetical protein
MRFFHFRAEEVKEKQNYPFKNRARACTPTFSVLEQTQKISSCTIEELQWTVDGDEQ